jgi:hypothetical protein
MGRYDSNFREPPWVMGSPKEVMDWMDAANPKKKDKTDKSFDKKFLNNLHVKFDFDVDKKIIDDKSFFSRLFKKKIVEEDFDLILAAKTILRGLSKAKFHNTSKIIVDEVILYDHPEKKSDLKKTIDVVDDFSDDFKKGKNVEITALFNDVFKCTAIIRIRRIHRLDEHSVDIQINGKIRKEIYHTFLNYIEEKIGFEKKD